MRLVWCNAMVYNIPGSKIYQLAKTLSESWELQWAALYPEDPGRLATYPTYITYITRTYIMYTILQTLHSFYSKLHLLLYTYIRLKYVYKIA